MKRSELQQLIKVAYEQVALRGRDAARIYHVVVALDQQVLELKKQLNPPDASTGPECEPAVD